MIDDIPPSIDMICPVIHFDEGVSKNVANSATLEADPIDFKGCLSALACLFSSLLNSLEANRVSVSDGAIQLTRMVGANSAARDLVSPSMAPLEEPIKEWKLKPF